jgi:phytoene dehydrogenase-like protein
MSSGSDDAEYRAGGRLRSFERGKVGFQVARSSGFVLFDGTRQVVTQAGDHDAHPEDELGRIDDRGDRVDRGVQDC